ncbi:hypothetical protein M0R88_14820 [Halorussus gelatinilyticus]|uniref:Uncharacterized protein n=1 Tax=Halorussus gelatinilyticus TaxID=2937524 RepID=A0A8U0IFC9_9EURY|nr:hypothetical protein [Halorussus gelatinilyticus]UPV99779.1 hypothetical protein M0R88_14820 [Halorussus gelatinilyticus]
MVSKAFFRGSKYLVEDNDGRHDYLRLNGERFLHALATAGQEVVALPVEADDQKSAYLKTLVKLNEGYFSAREFEADAKGKYLKHDERAERRFRIKTAERLSDLVDDLHAVLSAHDALVDAAVEHVEATESGDDSRRKREAVRAKLLDCTDRAVSGGWYATVESYYYSLSPGELVAEDRERRKQRIEGTEESRGIRELLGKPHFQRLAERDLRRIRHVNRESPGSDSRIWKRLFDEYNWYLGRERDPSVAAGEASKSKG